MARRANQRARGVIRDRKTGVVLSRGGPHPLLDVFTAIPVNSADYPEAVIPPLNMPSEQKQVMAIHVFDNLYPGLPGPPAEGETWHLMREDGSAVVDGRGNPVVVGPSKYRLVIPPEGMNLPNGYGGQMYLPWSVEASVASEQFGLADHGVAVEEMTAEQRAALKADLEAVDRAEKQNAALDQPKPATDPEWVKWRESQRPTIAQPAEDTGSEEAGQ